MHDLILNTDDRFSATETDTEQTGKLFDHKHGFIVFFAFDHPDNGIQRIV